MTLEAWQRALGLLVAWGGSPGVQRPTLDTGSAATEPWFERLGETPGFRITCTVQRWWRDLRLRTAAPLTLACVPDACADRWLEHYLDTHPASTQFFLAEALQFLDWVGREDLAAWPHARSIIAWEAARLRALLASRPRTAMRPLHRVRTAPVVALVPFSAPPEHVLTALILGDTLPAMSADRWNVLVVPGRPPRWRVASPAEERVLTSCRAPRSLESLCAEGASEALISELIAEGALEDAGPHEPR